jgi:serine/threonine-protein kinase
MVDKSGLVNTGRTRLRFERAKTLDCSAPVRMPMATPAPLRRQVPRIFRGGELLCGVYRVGNVLGTGGMSEVFAARDLRLDREVAIKACWPHISNSHLHQEGRLLGSFHHSSIVMIYYIGTHKGIDFLALERLHGVTLREHLRKLSSGLAIPDALDLLIALCDGLSVLHDAGVVHRDLKPANIMLTDDNHPVLIDLGVALRHNQWKHTRRMAGSPSYMAPESIESEVHDSAAHLLDIYSLGCMAYELLAGRVPFSGSETQFVLVQHLYRSIPRLSHRSEVPDKLDELVAEMMSKAPEQRPSSISEISDRLRDIRRELPAPQI